MLSSTSLNLDQHQWPCPHPWSPHSPWGRSGGGVFLMTWKLGSVVFCNLTDWKCYYCNIVLIPMKWKFRTLLYVWSTNSSGLVGNKVSENHRELVPLLGISRVNCPSIPFRGGCEQFTEESAQRYLLVMTNIANWKTAVPDGKKT